MAKSADAFRTISEVAEWLEVPAHVLRFWESKFSQIKPVKRAGGRRYYRPADMLLLGGIKTLLHDDGMTIKGVQKLLREQGVHHVSDLSQPLDEVTEGEVCTIALDVMPEPPEPAKVLTLARGGGEPPATLPKIAENSAEAAAAEEKDTPDVPAATEMAIPQDAVVPHDAPVSATPEPEQATSEPEPEVEVDVGAKATPSEPEVTQQPEPASIDADTIETTPEPEPEVQAGDISQSEATPEPAPLPQPDLPEDATDAISADPGLLAALADLPRPISTETAARLGPLLARLSALESAKSQDGQR